MTSKAATTVVTINEALTNGDWVTLNITKNQLQTDLGWDIDTYIDQDLPADQGQPDFDHFCLAMYKEEVRMYGMQEIAYNPGYGADNHGQRFEYEEWELARDIEGFGGQEGYNELIDYVLKNNLVA